MRLQVRCVVDCESKGVAPLLRPCDHIDVIEGGAPEAGTTMN
jgi:hypothetical protein